MGGNEKQQETNAGPSRFVVCPNCRKDIDIRYCTCAFVESGHYDEHRDAYEVEFYGKLYHCERCYKLFVISGE